MVEKIYNDKASGILIIPVWPDRAWFHQLGLVAVTWWDIPPHEPVFMTQGGIVLPQRKLWRTRVVVFDAFGAQREDLDMQHGQLIDLIELQHMGPNSVFDAEDQAGLKNNLLLN